MPNLWEPTLRWPIEHLNPLPALQPIFDLLGETDRFQEQWQIGTVIFPRELNFLLHVLRTHRRIGAHQHQHFAALDSVNDATAVVGPTRDLVSIDPNTNPGRF